MQFKHKPSLCGATLGAHCPKMVRGSGVKVMGIDSPFGGLSVCAKMVELSLEIGEILGDKV